MRYSIIGATAQQVLSAGGKNIKESSVLKIIFADLDEVHKQRLLTKGCTIDEVGQVKATSISPTPISASAIYTPQQLAQAMGVDNLQAFPGLYGEGAVVAILDSGILEEHEQISGHVVYRKNFTNDPIDDVYNHGTGVASLLLAVAPLCSIINVKVVSDDGIATCEHVVLAIDDMLFLHDNQSHYAPDIINLSIGDEDDGNPNNILRLACREAIERGIWVVSSAGNSGPDASSVLCPACEQYVVAVGSVSLSPFCISDFSSRGPSNEGFIKPDIVAFGENISMASSEGVSATIAKSGTSFATPLATGMLLLYLEQIYRQLGEHLPIENVLDGYVSSVCTKQGLSLVAKDNAYGYGMIYGPLIRPETVIQDISSFISAAFAMVGMGVIVNSMKS